MVATLQRPQSPASPSHERPGANKWFLAVAAVFGLFVGAVLGYWWGDSRSDPAADGDTAVVSGELAPLTEKQGTAVAIVDEVTEVLNTGDLEAARGFFVDDFGWSESDGSSQSDPQAYADEYFESLGDWKSAGYEFVPIETVVLGEPFGVMVDVCQFLTAHRDGAPAEALVMWYRVIPESTTIVEAGFSCES